MLCIITKVQTCWQKVIVIECSCLVKGFSFSFGNCACNYYNLCTTFVPRQLTKIYSGLQCNTYLLREQLSKSKQNTRQKSVRAQFSVLSTSCVKCRPCSYGLLRYSSTIVYCITLSFTLEILNNKPESENNKVLLTFRLM